MLKFSVGLQLCSQPVLLLLVLLLFLSQLEVMRQQFQHKAHSLAPWFSVCLLKVGQCQLLLQLHAVVS